MKAHWGRFAWLAMVVLLVLVGCRTAQPDLKPAKQDEVFNPPPDTTNLSGYPKQAFNNRNDDGPSRYSTDAGASMQSKNMPASFGGPSGGMR